MIKNNDLEWSNLEDEKCPRCGEKLDLQDGVYDCSSFDCVFSIRESKALDILRDMEIRDEFEGYNPDNL